MRRAETLLSLEKQWKWVTTPDVMTDSGRICPVGVIPSAVLAAVGDIQDFSIAGYRGFCRNYPPISKFNTFPTQET